MKTVTLDNGQVVRVGVWFGDKGQRRRTTTACLDTDRGQIQVSVACSEGDQFSRARGRLLAAQRLLLELWNQHPYLHNDPGRLTWLAETGTLTVADRRRIFEAVVVGYQPSARKDEPERIVDHVAEEVKS